MPYIVYSATFIIMASSDVPRDFVELPSQVDEHWAVEPEVIESVR